MTKDRAVVIYVDNSIKFVKEYNWLRYCFIHNGLFETSDLIVFCHPEVYDKIHDDCIKIKYESKYGSSLKYGYLNSLEIFACPEASFIKDYANVLKTDGDVFLTKNFNNWFTNGDFYCGAGAYHNSKLISENIKQTCDLFGLSYHDIKNTGSTWYGAGSQILAVGALSALMNIYLLTHYFEERHFNWPEWTYGVSSMYASEIALNHVIGKPLIFANHKLDYFSDSENEITDHIHIHCWHTNHKFSKFAFNDGQYKDIDINSLNLNKINDYCTYIALKSQEEYL